jgi:polyisoprenoid-binding protein YceI
MHFTGAAASVKSKGTLTMTGDLTIRGITKRISAPVTFRSMGTGAPGTFETTFQIDRTEFGLNGTPRWGGFNVSIAKKIQIHIAVAAIEGKPHRRIEPCMRVRPTASAALHGRKVPF